MITELFIGGHKQRALNALLELVQSVDIYMLHTRGSQQELVKTIFTNDELRDIVMNITASLKLSASFCNPPIPWEKIAGAAAAIVPAHKRASTLLPPVLENVLTASAQSALNVYMDNDWLVTMTLMRLWIIDLIGWLKTAAEHIAQLTPPEPAAT